MNSSVSIHDKKEFLKFFLDHYKLKQRECSWILKYVLNNDERLDQVSFVEDASNCPRAVEISTTCVDAPPFRYTKDYVETIDVEQSFHDIRSIKAKHLYIQLNFKDRELCEPYALVLEKNPFLSKEIADYDTVKVEVEKLLQRCLYEFHHSKLRADIDQAIDLGDRSAFLQLSQQLNNLRAI